VKINEAKVEIEEKAKLAKVELEEKARLIEEKAKLIVDETKLALDNIEESFSIFRDWRLKRRIPFGLINCE
jgi:hypothetical protein